MIVLIATYKVKPGMGDQVAEALHEMAPLVQAREPGCAMYQVCRAQENPDSFLLYEQYADDAALQAHRETPHFKRIIEGTVIPMLETRERTFYELIIS